MVSGRAVVAAGALVAVAAGGAVIARADDEGARTAQRSGGLSITPIVIDRATQVGAANAMTVANNSDASLDVTVKARPWTQSASGAVSPNRRGTLGAVGVSEQAFTLAPGATKALTVTLKSAPAGGYLFGALEVTGVPSDIAERKGVVTGYRLLGPLRYNAPTATYRLKAGTPKVSGKGSKKALTLAVRNTGNTLSPVTGTVRLKGPLGTKNASIKATKILPGKSVSLALLSGKSLRAGSYTATVTLIQNKQNTRITKRIKVRG